MNKQKGFTHEVIIVGVIIAMIIGALGFVFWRNYIQKDGDDKSAISTREDDSQKMSIDTEKYVTIDIWNVKFDAPAGEAAIEWAVNALGSDSIGFSTANLTDKDICKAEQGAAGSLQRSKEPIPQSVAGVTETMINSGKPINGYYYMFTLPNGQHCDNENPSDYDEALRIQGLVKSLQAE